MLYQSLPSPISFFLRFFIVLCSFIKQSPFLWDVPFGGSKVYWVYHWLLFTVGSYSNKLLSVPKRIVFYLFQGAFLGKFGWIIIFWGETKVDTRCEILGKVEIKKYSLLLFFFVCVFIFCTDRHYFQHRTRWTWWNNWSKGDLFFLNQKCDICIFIVVILKRNSKNTTALNFIWHTSSY